MTREHIIISDLCNHMLFQVFSLFLGASFTSIYVLIFSCSLALCQFLSSQDCSFCSWGVGSGIRGCSLSLYCLVSFRSCPSSTIAEYTLKGKTGWESAVPSCDYDTCTRSYLCSSSESAISREVCSTSLSGLPQSSPFFFLQHMLCLSLSVFYHFWISSGTKCLRTSFVICLVLFALFPTETQLCVVSLMLSLLCAQEGRKNILWGPGQNINVQLFLGCSESCLHGSWTTKILFS